MNAAQDGADIRRLTHETQVIWEQKAAFWDERMGEGNQFHRILVGPAVERLLAPQPGELILDIACGNGQFARRLAKLGVQVVAADFSAAFIERAKSRTTERADRIDYRVLDATDREQLLTLGQRRFDGAVCNMALMDMTTIDPLFEALSHLLKPGGRFVFSLLHPCFNSESTVLVAERAERGDQLVTTYSLKISEYLQARARKGIGIVGEPARHYYFHRPLAVLLGSCFRAGFVLDGIEEPAFSAEPGGDRPASSTSSPVSWDNFPDIPPVLAARLRLSTGNGKTAG